MRGGPPEATSKPSKRGRKENLSAESAAQQSPGRKPWDKDKNFEAQRAKQLFADHLRSEAKTNLLGGENILQPAPPLQGLTESHSKPRVPEHAPRAPSPWALLLRAFSALGIRLRWVIRALFFRGWKVNKKGP